MKVIGFTGKKGSGKSTASKYVLSKVNNSTQLNFKDGLIAELKTIFPETLNRIVDNYNAWEKVANTTNVWTVERLFEYKPPIVRALLQELGTNLRREEDPSYWVDQWEICAGMEAELGNTVVVDDVRFLNEAKAVRDQGGIIIRIVQEGIESNDTHVSETEMDSIEPNYTIHVKKGEFETLHKTIDTILNEQTN